MAKSYEEPLKLTSMGANLERKELGMYLKFSKNVVKCEDKLKWQKV